MTMITAKEHTAYDAQFPERFAWWPAVDQVGLCDLAMRLAEACQRDMETPERGKVPGLRHALNEIAQVARL